MRLSPAAVLTALSLRAGLPGDAWRSMLAIDWIRATQSRTWN